MTENKLKAEIAVLEADNQKLREIFKAYMASPEGDREAYRAVKEVLSAPLPPGLGSAMVRVVDAAKSWSQGFKKHAPGHWYRDPFLAAELNKAVQALIKQENRNVEEK